MLGNGAVGIDMGKGAVMAVAKGGAVCASAKVSGACRENRDGSSAVVVPARWVAGVLATLIHCLYNGLSVRTVIWPNGGANASGIGSQDSGRERDGIEVSTFC